ncbi:MAG: hypothetical protein NC937_03520 [Candidatus Omnitrophica bacterium]|nr:hypothetical protein [Candidatus Omnitrophota bacterium]
MMRTQTRIRIFCLALLCLIIFAIQTCTQASLNRLDVPAIRHLPDKYAGGEIIVVTIDVNPFLPAGAKIIEKVPDGWDLVGANPPLAKQPFRNMYVWEKPAKGENLTAIRYAVGVPKGNKSRKEFTGFIDIGKNLRLIVEGDRHIWGE